MEWTSGLACQKDKNPLGYVSFVCTKTMLVEGHLVPEWLWVQQFGRTEEEIFPMANHEFKSGDFKLKNLDMELQIKPA